MILQCPKETSWDDLKCKLQEVYSMVAMEYHAATDLLRIQRPNESLQDYITYWTEMCHCSMKMDSSRIKNNLGIVLFVKNMYNKNICRRVPGAKNINTLLNAFKSAQMNLLKLKKYEGLVPDDEHGQTVHTLNQIMSKALDMTDADRSLAQTDGYGQKYFPSTKSCTKQVSNQQMQMHGNPYKQLQPHFAPCYTCGVYGHLSIYCPQ